MKDFCRSIKSPAPSCGPGPHSWRDLWRQMKLARIAAPGFEGTGAYWNNRKNVSDLYMKTRTRQAWQGKVDAQFRAMKIPDGARVLDIGGGTGTHAIPLAARGCDVTVVEPAAAMREELEKNISASTEEVRVIPSRWEDVTREELGEPFDIVMASYSLSMLDIGDAIGKMVASSRGTVHLFWFLTPTSWARVSRDLWPRLYGREYPGEPLADCLWQVLFEMGIPAHLTTERKNETVYASADEAVREYCRRLNCTGEREEAVLQDYFREVLRPSGKGFALPGASYSAHIWWQSNSSPGTDRSW